MSPLVQGISGSVASSSSLIIVLIGQISDDSKTVRETEPEMHCIHTKATQLSIRMFKTVHQAKGKWISWLNNEPCVSLLCSLYFVVLIIP